MNTELTLIEKDRNVDILFACESGSRAWGFPSQDSDYDVRFLYTKPLDWYLSTTDKKDAINILDGNFDAVGWELKKSLLLLKKSNIPALEHLFSPILYRSEEASLKELKEIAKECFSPISAMFHYLSMSKKYYEKVDSTEVKLKSLFYALRTSLAGKWILEYKTMPPVHFREMLHLVEKDISEEIEHLIKVKSDVSETYMHRKSQAIHATLKTIIMENDRFAKSLPNGKPDTARIDCFLYKAIVK